MQRVVITRLVEETYYSRIVVQAPGGGMASVDARPGDSLSLALQLGRPIYVSRGVARWGGGMCGWGGGAWWTDHHA